MVKLSFDAGHGGFGVTPGKRTPDGEYEWSFNDKLVRAAMNYLDNYNVDLKRVDDSTGKTDVSLNERIRRINSFGSDFHCSFHNNANTGKYGDWGGTETYVHNICSDTSKQVARKVQDAVIDVLCTANRGNKDADFRILESDAPSCLVEFLFMDSKSDIKKLRNDVLLKNAGEAVAKVLIGHFNLKKDRNEQVASHEIKKPKANLKVDGKWGPATTKALQQYFDCKIIDGVISGQPSNFSTKNIPSVKFGNGGSNLVEVMQDWLETEQDRIITDPSMMIEALQERFKMRIVDSRISYPSNVVKEMQRRLNKGKL